MITTNIHKAKQSRLDRSGNHVWVSIQAPAGEVTVFIHDLEQARALAAGFNEAVALFTTPPVMERTDMPLARDIFAEPLAA